jgi:acetyl-CoA carboxylase carboxyltransferase component
VDQLYQHGKAANFAPFLTFDDVIDPADTRRWILAGLQASQPRRERAAGKYQAGVDPW